MVKSLETIGISNILPAARSRHIEQKREAVESLNKKLSENPNILIPKALHGAGRGIITAPLNEKAWHRQAAFFIAANYDIKQVAELCEVTTQAVRHVKEAPWFQEMVISAVNDRCGGKDLVEQFKETAKLAHVKLTQILEDPATKKELVANVALSYLDRVYGKAKQSVEMTATVRSADPVAEAAELARRNAQLRADLGVVDAQATVIAEGETGNLLPEQTADGISKVAPNGQLSLPSPSCEPAEKLTPAQILAAL